MRATDACVSRRPAAARFEPSHNLRRPLPALAWTLKDRKSAQAAGGLIGMMERQNYRTILRHHGVEARNLTARPKM